MVEKAVTLSCSSSRLYSTTPPTTQEPICQSYPPRRLISTSVSSSFRQPPGAALVLNSPPQKPVENASAPAAVRTVSPYWPSRLVSKPIDSPELSARSA